MRLWSPSSVVAEGSGMHGRVSTDLTQDASGHRARLLRRLFEGGGKALLDHELVEYLLALAIIVHDHVIVGASGRTSMRALGLI